MNAPKTLLLTDIPPCVNWTAGQATAQMSLAFAPDELVVFSVTNSELDLQPESRLKGLKLELHGKPNENYDPAAHSPVYVHAREADVRNRDIPRLVAEAIRFGQIHQVEQVWTVLQGQTLVRMAERVARGLGVPLKTLIWDSLKWWHLARGIDAGTQEIDNELLERAIRHSSFVIAPSWAMAEHITENYGIPSKPIIASIAGSVAKVPATTIGQAQDVVVAIAGQFYASDAWKAFVAALDTVGWVCGGRNIVVNVYGASAPPDRIDENKVRLKGWYAQADLVDAISRECDICYCPYPFDEDLREVSEFSFPSKVVVYLASGRPIFFHGPDYSSPGKYLDARAAGVTCYSREPASILGALERMIVDDAGYARLASAGSDAFHSDFTLDVQASLVNAHLRSGQSVAKTKPKWLRSRRPKDPYAVYRPYFDQFFYWNSRRDARNFEGGILAHYVAHGWRDGSDPHILFSISHYLASRPDVAHAGLEPLAHYLASGWREGTSPHPLFDVNHYLRQRPDVATAGVEPLAHYLAEGWHEGTDPHPLFSTAYYLEQRPDVVASGACPLIDYLTVGWREGVDPHPLFSNRHYLAGRADVAAAGLEPLTHFLTRGWREGADPHPLFSVSDYLALRPDVPAAQFDPLSHYVQHGWREGASPHPLIDVAFYTRANPELAATGLEPLSHYLRHGWREGRSISPWVDDKAYLAAYPALIDAGLAPLLDCAQDGWKQGREPAVWFSSKDYVARNPDVVLRHESPFFHYVRTGWREGRDPNSWFSIADFKRRSNAPLNREPMIEFLRNGTPAPGDPVHFTPVSDNFRTQLKLRQAARENERLRLALSSRPTPMREVDALDPKALCLTLIEDILGDVGSHVTHWLERDGLSDQQRADLWRLLKDMTAVSDRWLRERLVELDAGHASGAKR